MSLLERRQYEKVTAKLCHDRQVSKMREDSARAREIASLDANISQTYHDLHEAMHYVRHHRGSVYAKGSVEVLADLSTNLLSMIIERENYND